MDVMRSVNNNQIAIVCFGEFLNSCRDTLSGSPTLLKKFAAKHFGKIPTSVCKLFLDFCNFGSLWLPGFYACGHLSAPSVGFEDRLRFPWLNKSFIKTEV